MYQILRIDIINGERSEPIIVTGCYVNQNKYDQFKKDFAVLYKRVTKQEITVNPVYRDLNKANL